MEGEQRKNHGEIPAITLDEALEFNPVGFFQYRILLMCGFAFMADALEVNLLVFLSTCAGDEWNLNDQQQASITGVVFAGILLGSLFWGMFADRFGRKITFVIACSMISIGGFLSGAAPSFEWLLTFRAICGFGIGGANIPFDLLAEFLPSTHRGQFLIFIEYFWTFGSLFVTGECVVFNLCRVSFDSGIAWASLSQQGWRFLAYITAVPVTVTNLFSIFYLPESPRWLLMKGRNAEAEKIVREAALVNNITMAPFRLVNDEKNVHEIKDANYSDLIRIKEVRNVTLPLWIVWAAFGFTYYGLILFVGRIYEESSSNDDDDNQKCSFDYSSIFINATAEVVGVTVTALTIDKLGRINTQKVFYVLSAIAVFCMGIKMPLGAVLAVSLMGRMAIMSASNATWVSTPELFTTETRTVGHASSVAWSKVGAFISPYVVVSSLSPFALGIILAIVNVIAAIASHMLPETSGRFLENFHREVSLADNTTATLLTHNKAGGLRASLLEGEEDYGSNGNNLAIGRNSVTNELHNYGDGNRF